MRAFFSSALPDNPLNLAFLLVFTALFTGVVVWNLRPSRKGRQEDAARQPLND
jgi:cbb3-type cytochrome oxidase subunit 3